MQIGTTPVTLIRRLRRVPFSLTGSGVSLRKARLRQSECNLNTHPDDLKIKHGGDNSRPEHLAEDYIPRPASPLRPCIDYKTDKAARIAFSSTELFLRSFPFAAWSSCSNVSTTSPIPRARRTSRLRSSYIRRCSPRVQPLGVILLSQNGVGF